MKNPMFNGQHLKEYLLHGSLAAVLYIIPVVYFLYNNYYENLYYLYIGCFLFMAVIFYYNYKLLDQPYDRKRAGAMLIAGHLSILTGIIISCVLVVTAILFFFPNLFSKLPSDQIITDANDVNQVRHPSELLLMILATATIGNFGTGSFISVLVTYAGERDQTKDKPANLEVHLPPRK